MRIALVANGAWYLVNFRRGLIQKLIDLGHDEVCICPQDDYLPGLIELGVSWLSLIHISEPTRPY